MINNFQYSEIKEKIIEDKVELFFLAMEEGDVEVLKEIYQNNIPNENFSQYLRTLDDTTYLKLNEEVIQFIFNSELYNIQQYIIQMYARTIKTSNVINKSIIDNLEIISQKIPINELNENIGKFLLLKWGTWNFNENKHINVLNHIYENHPNLLMGIYKNTKLVGTHHAQQQHIIKIDDLFNNSQISKIITSLSEEDKKELFKNFLLDSMCEGHYENFLFFKNKANIVDVLQTKKDISDFIIQAHKHECFLKILEEVIEHIPIDTYDHLMVRTAISYGHKDTYIYLFDKYAENISTLKPIFQSGLDKKGILKKNNYLEALKYWEKLNLKVNLENKLEVKNFKVVKKV